MCFSSNILLIFSTHTYESVHGGTVLFIQSNASSLLKLCVSHCSSLSFDKVIG